MVLDKNIEAFEVFLNLSKHEFNINIFGQKSVKSLVIRQKI